MSMAFLRDDAEGEMPRRNYDLPERDDPDFNRAAARALLEAARVGETQLAERATGSAPNGPGSPSCRSRSPSSRGASSAGARRSGGRRRACSS